MRENFREPFVGIESPKGDLRLPDRVGIVNRDVLAEEEDGRLRKDASVDRGRG